MSDEEFLAAFEACELPAAEFRNVGHFRFAWLCLRGASLPEALERVRAGIRGFALHHGVPEKYHETITVAWLRLLATHREATFEEFLALHGHKLKLETLHLFWTPELLATERAKTGWAAPDRRELPV